MINARTLAFQILLHMDRKASHPDRLVRLVLARHPAMENRERALLTELVYGVLRWQGRLDWHIDQLSSVKPRKISPPVRILLRLALYQILLLDRIPPHAAVNETVNMAKGTQPPHVVGFVNALLRECLRRGDAWDWPSLETDPIDGIVVSTSHPAWFVRKILGMLGREETLDLCRANNSVAPLTVRVNSLKASASQALARGGEQGLHLEPSPLLPGALRISGPRRDIGGLPIHIDGWIQVQDEASQLVSELVAPRPGERVLDLCAGFGGKSTHLAALMGNVGEVLAVDKSAWKLAELRENAQRQGIAIIKTMAVDASDLSVDRCGKFDRVLLDAPCSGFGVLRRNPDIKWRRHPKDPYRFGLLQKSLIEAAARLVKPGGVLVYATCSIFEEENEEVMSHFTTVHPEWSLEPARDYLPDTHPPITKGPFYRSWPHRHGIDGFFGARWRCQG